MIYPYERWMTKDLVNITRLINAGGRGFPDPSPRWPCVPFGRIDGRCGFVV